MVLDSNFGPSKFTIVDRNFRLSKIMVVDQNIGPFIFDFNLIVLFFFIKKKNMIHPNGRHLSANLEQHLIGLSKIKAVGCNFKPSKVRLWCVIFDPPKLRWLNVVDRPKLRLWTVILDPPKLRF